QPLYGLLSDCLPLFGYRRKSYLSLFALGAFGAYISLFFVTAPSAIFIALMVVAVCMAAGSTITGAVMVENGKRYGLSGTLINQQWLWFNVAALFISYGAGWLSQRYGANSAYHVAALCAAAAPLVVLVSAWVLIPEERSKSDLKALRARVADLGQALRSRTVWLVGGFLVLYNFSPALGTPLFYHMTNVLHFQQQFIGSLGSFAAVGAIAGALLFQVLQRYLTMRALLYLSISLATLGHFSYLLLQSELSAMVLAAGNGIIGMIVLVSSLTLAADSCPDGSEGFSYAMLTSLATLSYMLSSNLGAHMYDGLFHTQIAPLIVISAVCTALALPVVPMLRLG
ncbi:MAG: MFS transporter, partial [Terriglobales bacterium]